MAGSIFLIHISILGPCQKKVHTWKRPIMDEQPGPPLNQVASGAVLGLFRASKNQNHIFSLPKCKFSLLCLDACGVILTPY